MTVTDIDHDRPYRVVVDQHSAPVISIRARMAPQVSDDKQPTEFGWWLLRQMANHRPPIASQSALSRALYDEARRVGANVNIGQSTISRWIYHDVKPDPGKVVLLAGIFGVTEGEILHRAGHGRPTPPQPTTDQLLVKLNTLLGEPSPIPAAELDILRSVLTGVIAPYEQYLRLRAV
jgi:hypothetical protein